MSRVLLIHGDLVSSVFLIVLYFSKAIGQNLSLLLPMSSFETETGIKSPHVTVLF